MQQVGGQQQLGLMPDALKQKGHRLVQGVALSQQQQPVELFILGAVELHLHRLLPIETREVDVGRMVEDLGASQAFGMAQDPVAVIEVAVQLHVADGYEAVEPGVGDGLHCGFEAVSLNALD